MFEIDRILLDGLIEKVPEILIHLNEIYLKRVSNTISRVKAR